MVGWLRAKARVCADSIIFDFASLNQSFKAFKSCLKSFEEYIVRVKWALSLIRVLNVKQINAFKVKSLQTFFNLLLNKLGVDAVS